MNLNKVKGMRNSIGMTQRMMANAIEMSYDTYTKKEVNDTFTANEVKKMIDVFIDNGLDVQFPKDFF